jgi:Holliday junction resolvase
MNRNSDELVDTIPDFATRSCGKAQIAVKFGTGIGVILFQLSMASRRSDVRPMDQDFTLGAQSDHENETSRGKDCER